MLKYLNHGHSSPLMRHLTNKKKKMSCDTHVLKIRVSKFNTNLMTLFLELLYRHVKGATCNWRCRVGSIVIEVTNLKWFCIFIQLNGKGVDKDSNKW